MKNILSLLIITVCIFLASSCKQKNEHGNKSDIHTAGQENIDEVKSKTSNLRIESDSQLSLIKNMTKIKPNEVSKMIQDAEVIINYRYKETEKKSYIILDKDLWEYEFIFSGKNMTGVNELAGCWIDFSDDMTYTYGKYQEELGSGKYIYSLDSGLLLLIDDADNIKPQEFETKVFDQTLVMDGNHIYKDNNYNAKLKRITQRPTKD